MKKKYFIRIAFSFILVCLGIILSVASQKKVQAYPTDLKKYQQVDTEFRAVWVATVYNLDIKKMKSTSETDINEWKKAYLTILDNAQAANLNVIIFQIRPCNDAFYPSKYNPWSEYLCGYGTDPGFDPLQWMIEVTHERGMEYHAWMNPYRASVNSEFSIVQSDKVIDYNDQDLQNYKNSYFSGLKAQGGKNTDGSSIDNPVFASGEELKHNVVLGTEGKFVLNPAADETIDHLKNTITEVIENYDIDGIHFDDYFYPYTKPYTSVGTNNDFKGKSFSTEPMIDYADYQTYIKNGGTLSIYDWRRSNTDRLIQNLSIMIEELNKKRTTPCAFGISPAARWAPTIESCPAGSERGAEGGMSGSCNNYYSYSDLYANTKKWVDEKWIDYILPQSYTQLDGSYGEIVKWWSDVVKNSPVKLYIGTALYQLGEWNAPSEVYYQIRYNQSSGFNVSGYSMYDYTSMTVGKGKSGMNLVKNSLWKNNALTPTYAKYTYPSTVEKTAEVIQIKEIANSSLRVTYELVSDAKAYGLYKFTDEDINNPDNYTPDKLIAMNLQNNDGFTITNYDELAKYVIVTYAKDNSLHIGKQVDFTNIVVNNPPQIEIVYQPTEVLVEKPIQLKFKISDVDQEVLSYKVYLLLGNNETLIEDKTSQGGLIEIETNGYYVSMKNMKFKIVVSDELNETIVETDLFHVVEKCTTHQPMSEATCTSASVCTICQAIIQPPLGHTPSDWIVDVEATCTAEGRRHKVCTKCKELVVDESIPNASHKWLDATTQAPKTCTACGITEGEKLPTKKNCNSCNKNSVAVWLNIFILFTTIPLIMRKRKK